MYRPGMADRYVLTPANLETFRSLAEVILPPLPQGGPAWEKSGAELGLEKTLPGLFGDLPTDRDRRDLKRLLALLDSRLGGLFLFGRASPFSRLPVESREASFRRLLNHPSSLIRGGARALKALVGILWVAPEDSTKRPIAWDAMGYPGPSRVEPVVTPQLPLTLIDSDRTLACDVVIVGSGVGGSVAAAVLAEAGLSVVVLEAGTYSAPSNFSQLERETYRRMYLSRGLSTTADGGTNLLAGATLGGGSVINYSTSLSTPENVRREWDRISGFDGVFTGAGFEASTFAVQQRLNVNTDHSAPSMRDIKLDQGLEKMGWHSEVLPRNVDGCTPDQCGYCTMGCRIGAKQDMTRTFLVDAAQHMTRIVTGAKVTRILTEFVRATGVVAEVGEHTLTVRARAVVVAAGALSTPAILLRSGLGGKAVGRYLRLHPVTAVWGRFAEPIEPWLGMMQTRVSDQFGDLDGNGYGVKFETAPIHPLFPAAFHGWDGGGQFKRDMLGFGHIGLVGILTRDRDHGEVATRRDGTPVWRYKISKSDQRSVREGVLRGAELLAAAGAVEIMSSNSIPVRWDPTSESADQFITNVDRRGYGANRMGYFSFHQMGSARMGSSRSKSVVDANNEAHRVPGLYVMDSSAFPTASGVNPMISIAAIAHRAAGLLAQRLVD